MVINFLYTIGGLLTFRHIWCLWTWLAHPGDTTYMHSTSLLLALNHPISLFQASKHSYSLSTLVAAVGKGVRDRNPNDPTNDSEEGGNVFDLNKCNHESGSGLEAGHEAFVLIIKTMAKPRYTSKAQPPSPPSSSAHVDNHRLKTAGVSMGELKQQHPAQNPHQNCGFVDEPADDSHGDECVFGAYFPANCLTEPRNRSDTYRSLAPAGDNNDVYESTLDREDHQLFLFSLSPPGPENHGITQVYRQREDLDQKVYKVSCEIISDPTNDTTNSNHLNNLKKMLVIKDGKDMILTLDDKLKTVTSGPSPLFHSPSLVEPPLPISDPSPVIPVSEGVEKEERFRESLRKLSEGSAAVMEVEVWGFAQR